MPQITRLAAWSIAALSIASIAAHSQPAGPPAAVLYEGARLISGDGSAAIERSAFVVQNGAFTRIGRQGELTAPPGATRVDLAGKTVMPAIIDTHTHLSQTREGLIDDMRRRA